jgi:signal transduction histidine kinase
MGSALRLRSGRATSPLRLTPTRTPVIPADAPESFTDRLAGRDGSALVIEMAHDMRSPLSSILFLSEMLQNGAGGPVTEAQRRQLGLVYGAALGLASLVNDVMELAQGASRLLEDHPTPFDLRHVVDQVLSIVRPIADEKGLDLRVMLADVGVREGHPAAISRVLLNLITNGLKYTERGYVAISAESVDATRIRFTVTDSGRGIPEALRQTLTEAFRSRADGTRHFSSSGLGLATCRRILQQLDATVDVSANAPVGTRFEFTLALPPATTA